MLSEQLNIPDEVSRGYAPDATELHAMVYGAGAEAASQTRPDDFVVGQTAVEALLQDPMTRFGSPKNGPNDDESTQSMPSGDA